MVREGYKQTEVGVIPEDWEVVLFEDVMDGFSSGATPYRKIKEFYVGNINWITSGELNYNTITDTYEKISEEAVRATNLTKLKPGTFLIAITGLEAAGTRGSCGIVGVESTSNQSCMALIPKEGILSLDYLFQYYSYFGDKLALEYCQGTKQQSYTGKLVKRLPLILPPTLPEQTAIAKSLSDTDALLSSLDALIGKKEAFKRGMMEGLLGGEVRLDGFSGEWEETTFGECFDVYSTASFSRANMKETGDVGCVHYGDIHTVFGTHFDGTIQSLPMISNAQAGTYRRIKNGDLVFSDASEDYEGIGQMVEFCNMEDIEAIGGLHTYLLSPHENLFAPYFAGYISLNPLVKNQMIEKSTGTTVYGISKDNLRSVALSLPPVPEQRAIATVLSDLDAELSGLRARRAKLGLVKAGMMEVLLSGRVRLV